MDHTRSQAARLPDAAAETSQAHPRVLISYAHESPTHDAIVLSLADRLCMDGIDCALDQYVESPAEGWEKWMADEVDRANFVLVVCSERYVARCRGDVVAAVGSGIAFESLLLWQDLAEMHPARATCIPVLLRKADVRRVVPRPLRAFQRYIVDGDAGYESLYRRLTGQPRVRKPPVGPVQQLPTAINVKAPSKPVDTQVPDVVESAAHLAETRQCIEIRIERDFDTFREAERDALLKAIGELIGISGEVRVVKIIRGSVTVVLEVSRHDAVVIYKAHARGQFNDFDVTEVHPSLLQLQTGPLAADEGDRFPAEAPFDRRSRVPISITSVPGWAPRVLVVDDEPSICKALTMFLSRAGFDAVSASTAEAALGIVRTEHVDAMIVDLRIPDIRGDVLFEVAVGHQPHLKTQTVFMTGDITERASKLIAACGCSYLRKPFDLQDLIEAVATITRKLTAKAGRIA